MEHNGYKIRIITYVMTWDGVVTNFHRRYAKEIGITDAIGAYIQAVVLKNAGEHFL